MRCGKCLREAETQEGAGPLTCCEPCGRVGVHSPECNARTYPEWKAAKYLDDEDATMKILERLQKSLILSHLLETEFREIQNAARRFIPGYATSSLELMIHHLQIDISYAGTAARELLGR